MSWTQGTRLAFPIQMHKRASQICMIWLAKFTSMQINAFSSYFHFDNNIGIARYNISACPWQCTRKKNKHNYINHVEALCVLENITQKISLESIYWINLRLAFKKQTKSIYLRTKWASEKVLEMFYNHGWIVQMCCRHYQSLQLISPGKQVYQAYHQYKYR